MHELDERIGQLNGQIYLLEQTHTTRENQLSNEISALKGKLQAKDQEMDYKSQPKGLLGLVMPSVPNLISGIQQHA